MLQHLHYSVVGVSHRDSLSGSRWFPWEYTNDYYFISFSELCWGKAMVAYTKPRRWKKEESERLRGERLDQVY